MREEKGFCLTRRKAELKEGSVHVNESLSRSIQWHRSKINQMLGVSTLHCLARDLDLITDFSP